MEKGSVIPANFISLFSGCGGFDEGFEAEGFISLGAYDNNRHVVNVYKNNLKGPVYLHDLMLQNLPNSEDIKKVDIVLSGSPCQGFSTAGQRDFNDPRNKLLVRGAQIALEISPKIFVAENVMGSTSGRHKDYWDTLINLMKKGGYNSKLFIVNSENLGLPQTRRRVILISWKGKSNIELNIEKQATTSLKDVLQNLDGLPNQDSLMPVRHPEILKYIRPGQKLCNVRSGDQAIHTWHIPEIYGEITPEEEKILEAIKRLRRRLRTRDFGDADPVAYTELKKYMGYDCKDSVLSLIKKKYLRLFDNKLDLNHTFNGLYRRLQWEKPSFTVDTQFGNPRYFIHPEFDRGFTVREAARIQGFRDDFVFSGPISQQFKMIGNAVPPPMARFIARSLKSIFL